MTPRLRPNPLLVGLSVALCVAGFGLSPAMQKAADTVLKPDPERQGGGASHGRGTNRRSGLPSPRKRHRSRVKSRKRARCKAKRRLCR